MHTFVSKVMARAGMALGVTVIGGSIVGGILLATNARPEATQDTGVTVPVGNDSTPTPAASAASTAESTPASGTGDETTAAAPSTSADVNTRAGERDSASSRDSTSSTPSPQPTCWDESWPGEHPDGIEDCEDGPGDH